MDLNNKNKANIDENRLDKMCFSNVYVIELLAKYGFDSIENIQVVEKVIVINKNVLFIYYYITIIYLIFFQKDKRVYSR
jgi:hypothetical protein